MSYSCFIETPTSSAPYMEPIDADTLEQARWKAQRLLTFHSSAQRARILLDDQVIEVLRRAGSGPQTIVSDNRLLAATALTRTSERRHLRVGEVLVEDAERIWFPLDVLLRIEAADQGLLAGWVDREGAIGLTPPRRSGALRFVVQQDGYAVGVSRTEINERLRADPDFNAAVIHWLSQSLEDALLGATLNLRESAFDRVVRLLGSLSVQRSEGPVSICQAEIGRLLGLQRTTVSGVMTRLRDAQAIKYSRGRVKMFDPQRLAIS